MFLTGPFHLWVLVLRSVKKVAEPGRPWILPGAVGVGSLQLGGLRLEAGQPFLLFPRLEKMSPAWGISVFCLLGSSVLGADHRHFSASQKESSLGLIVL